MVEAHAHPPARATGRGGGGPIRAHQRLGPSAPRLMAAASSHCASSLSHFWKHAQDQCCVLKSLLYTMLPTCKIYLDEDDMDQDDEVMAQVEQAFGR